MFLSLSQIKPMLAIWRAGEDIKDRDVSTACYLVSNLCLC